jgi:hypothetical protein
VSNLGVQLHGEAAGEPAVFVFLTIHRVLHVMICLRSLRFVICIAIHSTWIVIATGWVYLY